MGNALKLDYTKYDYGISYDRRFYPQSMGEIEYIEIDRIEPNQFQPRKNFNKTALMELADSIRAYGVLQPINVRQAKDDKKFELVAGERRLRAAQLAGLNVIPCIIVAITDNDSAAVALVENLQREDLNFIEEAEGYTALLVEHGMTQDDLARKIGKSQSTVANKIRILKLSVMIRKILMDNNLTERHARALLKLESEQQQLDALENICKYKLNVKRTEDLVDKILSGEDPIYIREEMSNIYGSRKTAISYTEKPAVKRVIKDIRIFVNTIKESVEMLKEAGVKAKAAQFDREDYLEFIVRIPKKENSL